MNRPNNKGQAATEFVIAAVFVLVPLFLIVPLLGKYIDIRHAAVQQARYEAWECTVYYGPNDEVKYGVEPQYSAGEKNSDRARREGKNFFFVDPFQKKYGTSKQSNTINPLWIDHHGNSLFYKKDQSGKGLIEKPSENFIVQIVNTVFGGIKKVFGFFGKILTFIGVKGTFDIINNQGFYVSELEVKVRSPEDVVPLMALDGVRTVSHEPLVFKARAGVQSDFWNSGSRDMASAQTRGMILSAVLSPVTDTLNKIINVLQKIINVVTRILPVTIQLPHFPDFGYVKDDLVPYEHLKGNSTDGMGEKKKPTIHKASGLYYYAVENE